MPVKRRKPKARITGYPDWQVEFLLTGEAPSDEDPELNPFEVIEWRYHGAWRDDAVLVAWNECRDKLLPDWIRRHPGTRPYGWWACDSGLERRKGGIEVNGKVIGKNVMYTLRNSIPEDQRTWLAEHDLLQPGE